ncbi:hypothetical protein EOI86_12830 [Hwanghaeella grinnelliae]|uniref:MBL fold metallo-hydrolase n=1 Tax=Hwanghaeella grinnelliae TaxID=2500179 RepID=A0A437QNI4_9PROT|nr:hypothetical protein [Hwanghaeella grinnelliae]RVU36108.1 hypothetical protein EOI86_12830 [Hwanghaeella grinnelliae]
MTGPEALVDRIEGFADVFTVRQDKLSCTVLRLPDGGLCLYSPLPKLTDTVEVGLRELGEVTVLLAPNHYHNRGLAVHAEAYPKARLICSRHAAPRLTNQTGFDFEAVDQLAIDLPESIRVLEPEGLKTGEIWIEVEAGAGLAWIVCDAFNGPPFPRRSTPGQGSVGQIYADTPSLLGTFPKFGVGDRDAYKAWAIEVLSNRKPTIMIPCHGLPVTRPGLDQALRDLVTGNL